jgi:hypothetical protein
VRGRPNAGNARKGICFVENIDLFKPWDGAAQT